MLKSTVRCLARGSDFEGAELEEALAESAFLPEGYEAPRSSSAQLGAAISTASPATLRQRALGVVSHYGCQGGCSGFGGRGDAVELEGVNRFWRELSRRVL
jgi:hypothetical protein